MRKTLIAVGAVLAVMLSGAVAVASVPVPAPTGLEGTVGTVQPVRVLDTRTTGGPLAAGATRTAVVTGLGSVPASGVSAVIANVTVTNTAGSGYLTVWPADVPRPGTSNLNFVAGQTVPNLVVTKVSANGSISIFNGSGGTANVIVDVTGYVADAADASQPRPASFTVTYRGLYWPALAPLPSAFYPLVTTAPVVDLNGQNVPVGSMQECSASAACVATAPSGWDIEVRDSTEHEITLPGIPGTPPRDGARNAVDLTPYRALLGDVNVFTSPAPLA